MVVHYTGPGDQIEMLIPWTTLAWTQVHHGHLPLWNPYSGLGMPLAFNWQSATFSLPALVGYCPAVRLAFTVAQIATVLVWPAAAPTCSAGCCASGSWGRSRPPRCSS